MPRLKTDIVFDDSDEFVSRRRPSNEMDPKSELRCQVVMHAQSGRDVLIPFLMKHESEIRSMDYPSSDGAVIRRAVDRLSPSRFTLEDMQYLDSLFGPLIPVTPVIETPPVDIRRRPMTDSELIEYMRDCTFEFFEIWLLDSEDFIRGLDDDQLYDLRCAVEHVCMADKGLPRQRHAMADSQARMLDFISDVCGDNRRNGCSHPEDAC